MSLREVMFRSSREGLCKMPSACELCNMLCKSLRALDAVEPLCTSKRDVGCVYVCM